jgi:hypothetical protein
MVQERLGHANIATTRLYDRRKYRPEDSPTFTDPNIRSFTEGPAKSCFRRRAFVRITDHVPVIPFGLSRSTTGCHRARLSII